MIDKLSIEALAGKHGFPDFQWISGNDVQVRHWVRFKCMFGCNSYGKRAACPPAVPSVPECRELFVEYDHILVLQIAAQVDPNDLTDWSRQKNLELLSLERAVFLAGHHKTLLLFMDECRLCDDCLPARTDCRKPALARPCPEALGMDVFSTVRSAGFTVEVLTECHQEMKKYAFLLVE